MKLNMLILSLIVPAIAYAQEPNPYNGTWKAEYTGKSGAARVGKVVVSDKTGTWQMAVSGRGESASPCIGREFPIEVTKANATELAFEVQRAKTRWLQRQQSEIEAG